MAYDPERKVFLGELERRAETVRFGIKEADRSRHMYVIGQTGTGKSTLLEIMAMQDIANGEGLIFLDPHGQSVESLLQYIPEDKIKDTIYFAPHLQDYPIGLNIMEDIGYDRRHLVVSSLIAAFHRIWGEGSWSDRMEYILTNTLLALIEYPDSTLLDIGRMYNNKVFRNKVIENVKDPQVKKYWVEDFARYTERYAQEATPAIQNKIGQFTSNPLIRNIIGQSKSAFDFREIMDNKMILLVNLSKGQIGENNAKMLGTLFTTKIYLDALSRSDMTRMELDDAPPCNFYVDEFQSFANSTFAGILSEARKYKLNLVLAHQYIGQLNSEDGGNNNAIRDAVFGNVGTFITFRVGPIDAEIIAKQFSPDITEDDLVSLPRRNMYMTLNIDGAGSPPFSARTSNIPEPPLISFADEVIRYSTNTYGKDRVEIEEKVKILMEKDWLDEKEAHKKASAAGEGNSGNNKKRNNYNADNKNNNWNNQNNNQGNKQWNNPSGNTVNHPATKPVNYQANNLVNNSTNNYLKEQNNKEYIKRDLKKDWISKGANGEYRNSKPEELKATEKDKENMRSGLRDMISKIKVENDATKVVTTKKDYIQTPPINYKDGWVSLKDLNKNDGDANRARSEGKNTSE